MSSQIKITKQLKTFQNKKLKITEKAINLNKTMTQITNKVILKKMEINLLISLIDKRAGCKKGKSFHSQKKPNLEKAFL